MKYLLFVPFLGAVVAAGATGTFFQTGEWYRGLIKPSWTPPNWLFPVVWTFLYIGIAIAGWRVAMIASPLAQAALAFWALQMVLNTLWTPVVFGANDLFAGVIVIVAMWFAILVTTVLIWQVDRVASFLFIPYLAWVGYATALNVALWRLNT